MRRTILAALFVIALGVATPRPAFACSCVPFTPQQLAAEVTDVFTGTVERVERPLVMGSTADPVLVHVRVDRVYKGTVTSTARIETALDGASCGYDFREGVRYTILARDYDSNGTLNTNLCLQPVEGDIDPAAYGLPQGQPPSPSSDASREMSPAALALGAILVLAAILYWRRARGALLGS